MTETTEPTPVEETREEVQPQDQQLPEMLRAYSGAPTQEVIEQWKAQFGEVYVSGFSPEELFVWRAITRPEYVRIQTMAANPEHQMDQFKLQELICETCVLYKTVSRGWNEGKAGTPDTLSEQIMQNSNFLSPGAASMLVAKL